MEEQNAAEKDAGHLDTLLAPEQSSGTPQSDAKETAHQSPNPYLIPLSILVAGMMIAGAVMYANKGGTASSASGGLAAGAGEAAGGGAPADPKALADDDPVLGNPDAPVTVVEFSDYQCPFCGRFYKTVEKQLIDTYVKTGKVKFVYRDFAFLGDESQWAAQAANCAGDQGKYWQYHDYLFDHQQGENEGAFSKANLKRFAKDMGLNNAQFDLCLDSGKHEAEVAKDVEAGRQFGVGGTPTTFINGKLIAGAQPFAAFEQAIEEALKK